MTAIGDLERYLRTPERSAGQLVLWCPSHRSRSVRRDPPVSSRTVVAVGPSGRRPPCPIAPHREERCLARPSHADSGTSRF